MQPLGDIRRLPRVIAGSGSDDLGGLRPGRERASDLETRPARAFASPTRRASWGWMTAVVMFAAAISLFHLPTTLQHGLRDWADQMAVYAGFGVDHVAVVGHNHTPMSDIVQVLDLDTDRSLLAYNREDVRRKLKQLRWIDSVRVVHILPDTLSIEISERRPYAIWQRNARYSLIDRSGHTLGAFDGSVSESKYPLVVGRGAAVNAAALVEAMAQFPSIRDEVSAYVRVADRRWNLMFRSGKKIMLPETGLNTALSTLNGLFAQPVTRGAGVVLIDLRIPARPTVRLSDAASGALVDDKTARRAAALLLSGGPS